MGRGPSPSFVISAIKRLPDDSMTAALASGGREFFGWGVDRSIQADIYDAVNQNTRASGNWAKKAPDIPFYPRPQLNAAAVGKPEKKPVSLESLHRSMMLRM